MTVQGVRFTTRQGPKFKQLAASFEEPNPLGRVLLVMEHHGVEVPVTIPIVRGEGQPGAYTQAEQFLREMADACAHAAHGIGDATK
ncbi:hypothetical protein [Methylobacterium fujisawaense]